MLTAFFVMLREGFEAALIVAILYAYLRKVSRQDLIPADVAGGRRGGGAVGGSGVVDPPVHRRAGGRGATAGVRRHLACSPWRCSPG